MQMGICVKSLSIISQFPLDEYVHYLQFLCYYCTYMHMCVLSSLKKFMGWFLEVVQLAVINVFSSSAAPDFASCRHNMKL